MLFPQVIPRSPVHGQADHCDRQNKLTALHFLQQGTVSMELLMFITYLKNIVVCVAWQGALIENREAVAKFGICH